MDGPDGDGDRLAADYAAMRRVAELVARGAPPQEVLGAITVEGSGLAGVDFTTLLRFEGDGSTEIVSVDGAPGDITVGMRASGEGDGATQRVWRTGRAARVDDLGAMDGAWPQVAHGFGFAASAAAPIRVAGRLWGALVVVSRDGPLPPGIEQRLLDFAELASTAVSSAEARSQLRALADEQTALRRVAELVAQEESTGAVLQAVALQASRLAGVEFGMVLRFEPDGSNEIVAVDGAPENFRVGLRAPATGDSAVHRVWRTRRAARIDDLGSMSGQWPRMAHRFGFTTSAGVPIFLRGRLWGAIIVVGREGPMSSAVEGHLSDFAELVGTAIAAAQARAELRTVAHEQAALRRVATLVANGARPSEIFAVTAAEICNLLAADAAVLWRYEANETATVIAIESDRPLGIALGTKLAIEGGSAMATIYRTGEPARQDKLDEGAGPIAAAARTNGLRTAVGAPITVDGRLWGAVVASSRQAEMPDETALRTIGFTELLGTAIANADSRSQLLRSRARVLTAADDARRRLARDLHDGAQQRLVHTIVTLKLALRAMDDGATGKRRLEALVTDALEQAESANAELRNLSHGILPVVLTHHGLRAAIDDLVARAGVPVAASVTAARLPPAIEASAYFVAAESLTNVAKHAHATRASLQAWIDETTFYLEVRDDGVGGARLDGTGLLGLQDRATALGGRFRVESPLGDGTRIRVELPVSFG